MEDFEGVGYFFIVLGCDSIFEYIYYGGDEGLEFGDVFFIFERFEEYEYGVN